MRRTIRSGAGVRVKEGKGFLGEKEKKKSQIGRGGETECYRESHHLSVRRKAK